MIDLNWLEEHARICASGPDRHRNCTIPADQLTELVTVYRQMLELHALVADPKISEFEVRNKAIDISLRFERAK